MQHNIIKQDVFTDPKAITPKNALISVSDKTGLTDLVQALHRHGINIMSTGGTARAIKDLNIPVTEVSDYTGFPEMMDGRVKTLNPLVHGGILAKRDDKAHTDAMEAHNISPIDLVIINLYPFENTVSQHADNQDLCIENIDIGGPAMIRSAAKNFYHVAVVTDPADYNALVESLDTHNGSITYTLRQYLAANAFARTAVYDSAIGNWFSGLNNEDSFPRYISFAGYRKQHLRYGENPHQKAALYTANEQRPGISTATQIQGKELSYNNLNDTDAAFELVAEFDEPAVAIIKHANPCGTAVAETTLEAYNKAFLCDPVSAFGGIIALNRPLNKETAEKILQTFCEVIIAPSIEPAAMSVVSQKSNIRVLTTGGMPDPTAERLTIKTLASGLLVQTADNGHVSQDTVKVVTDREPTQQEMQDLLIAAKVCKHVKSNAIVFVKDGATVGIGAGQMSRIDSVEIAYRKGKIAATEAGSDTPLTHGAVVASDAFFPFADGLLAAAEAGATAIIQPGGSIRDNDVIQAANDRGLAMMFSGIRNFKH